MSLRFSKNRGKSSQEQQRKCPDNEVNMHKDDITAAMNWAISHKIMHIDLIETDPLMADHHRTQRDMFDLVIRIAENSTRESDTAKGG